MAEVSLANPPPVARAGKIAAAVLMIVLAPVLLAATLAVLLSGPGEVLVRVPAIRADGRLTYRWAFRISPRFEPARYDEATRRSKLWLTPVGAALRRSGIARLPVLFDIYAGRVGFVHGLTT